MKTIEIYNTWKNTFELPNQVTEDCFNQLLNAYQNPKRAYHNLTHIGAILKQIELFEGSKDDRLKLTYAAFFHDVVYRIGNNTNELESSVFANIWLNQLGVAYELIHPICAMIEATATHCAEDHLSRIFVDMDLSILGANKEQYLHYTDQIRQEHQCIPSFLYRIGRKKLIQEMLLKPFIFQTKGHQDRYEHIARKNLFEELKTL